MSLEILRFFCQVTLYSAARCRRNFTGNRTSQSFWAPNTFRGSFPFSQSLTAVTPCTTDYETGLERRIRHWIIAFRHFFGATISSIFTSVVPPLEPFISPSGVGHGNELASWKAQSDLFPRATVRWRGGGLLFKLSIFSWKSWRHSLSASAPIWFGLFTSSSFTSADAIRRGGLYQLAHVMSFLSQQDYGRAAPASEPGEFQ